MLKNAKWIWTDREDRKDDYADFKITFTAHNAPTLNIAVDGNFVAYLNGELCAFGSCADYPFRKFYDSFPLKDFKNGENELLITVWHIGLQSSTYAVSNAGLIFTVTDGDRLLAASNEDTPSRQNRSYTNGLAKYITVQLGPSYRYDNTVTDSTLYTPSVAVEKSHNLTRRPIKNLELLPRAEIKSLTDDGTRLLVDLGRETAGFLELDLECDGAEELLISFGEHLDEKGRVPRRLGSRDFSVEFAAKRGKNKFLGGMRRIACRYLEIEHKSPIRIGYVGIRPTVYPLAKNNIRFKNPLHNRIYEVCVHTLVCCMHEHYEDCPWREQALYALDSRNQMLTGYVAFSEYEYPRHNLTLLGDGLDDGLIKLTSPSDIKLPIPFFSLVYIMQTAEYVKFSGDHTVINDLAPVLHTVMNSFTSRIDETGLIPNFPTPAWNFYEWTEGNDGHSPTAADPDRYDLALNAMYLYVANMYQELTGKNPAPENMRSRIAEFFYDKERGFFKNSNKDDRLSLIANSLAILAGVADKSLAERLVRERDRLTDVSLSTTCFFYDALLASGIDARDYIISDIEEKYSYMLENGATTFWETIDGAKAFSGAGSLCHGWSALPIYYLDLLADKE